METVTDFIFWGSKITADCDCSHEIKKRLLLGRKVLTNLDSILNSRDITLPGYGFSSSHVWLWFLDYKESWAPKNWCFWIVVLEKTLESPLDCKEIQPVHPKGHQSWVFIGRTDVEAEIPILWSPDVKSWLIGKYLDPGKDWRWRRRGWQRMRWLMVSLTLWTWVWVNSVIWWWTGRPGVLQSMGSQSQTRLSDWLNWTERKLLSPAWRMYIQFLGPHLSLVSCNSVRCSVVFDFATP